jgi:hypothetical protein
MERIDFSQHLENLVTLSSQDLSLAHVTQHQHGAELSANIANLPVQGSGAYSSGKKTDTVKLENGRLTGKKFWISNLSRVSWAIVVINHQVIYVELDHSTQTEIVHTIGMEATFTGHLILDQTPCQVICDIEDNRYFFARRSHSLGFIANHMGLCQALYDDIDRFTVAQHMDCSYQKQKLKLQLDVMNLVWNDLPKNLTVEHRAYEFWRQKNTAYAFAKKCLTETCQFVTEMTGSGLYQIGTTENQRYKDALLYNSHMQNLYRALENRA